jgi:arylesterase / paraoxonase
MKTVRLKFRYCVNVDPLQDLGLLGRILLATIFLSCGGCAVYFPNNPIKIDPKHIDQQTCKSIPSQKQINKDPRLKEFYGPEDITISSNIAYISGDNRRDDEMGGGIYSYHLADDSLKKMVLKSQEGFSKKSDFFKETFHPHGISLYEGPQGDKWLFVINHRKICCKKHSYVEVFKIQGDELIHRESIPEGESVNNLNDLVAINKNQYYATNNGGFLNRITGAFLRWGRDEVVFYDGNKYHMVLDNFAFANGINYNPEKKLLIVSSSLGGKIWVYEETRVGDSLPKLKPIDEPETEFGALLDNLEWADDKKTTLLVSAHPSPIKFIFHGISDKLVKHSPSQVIKFSINEAYKSIMDVKEIYSDDGENISASSVAAKNGDKLLIGNVFSSHILVCDSKQ